LDAFKRGSIPQISMLMAATAPATDSAPPAASASIAVAPAVEGVSGPAVPDSSSAVTVAVDSATMAAAPAAALSPETTVAGATALPVPPASAAGPPAPPVVQAPAAPTTPTATPAATPANGRTELQGGMYALRSGDTVTVYFDTPEARTRRPDKFEQIVRSTLPAVHGNAAETLLSGVTPGTLIGAVDLVGELPSRGLHLRATDGRVLSLWPETRPGRDGLLVVAYRSVLSR
jgi:hypothetical protein